MTGAQTLISYILNSLRAHPELAIFLTLASGFVIGRIRVGTFKLGNVVGTLIAGVLIGHNDLERVDRLHDRRLRLLRSELERLVAGDLEGDVLTVDRVHLAVEQRHFDIHHMVAGCYALAHRRANALFDRWDERAINHAADNAIHELQRIFARRVGRQRLDSQGHIAKLARRTSVIGRLELCEL